MSRYEVNSDLHLFEFKFQIHPSICFAKAGATFETISKIFPPVETFKEGDVLLLFVFGNDIFKKGSHQIERGWKSESYSSQAFLATD
jgi:hypothetical protein